MPERRDSPSITDPRRAAAAGWRFAMTVILAASLLPALAAQGPPDQEGIAFFEKHVRPLLVERCYGCHSAEGRSGGAKEPESGLLLDTRAGLLRGGTRGPAIVPRDPEGSLLLRAVRAQGGLAMPPDPKRRLSADEVKRLEIWIAIGAPDPRTGGAAPRRSIDVAASRKEWPFRPVSDPPVPAVRDGSWPRTGIDRFLLARLEEAGIRPAPDTDRRTLIRRAHYDLIGLPPTPEDVEAFVADGSPDAFEKLVDRLLASPHHGERWGRRWLDVVRYADTAGDNSDYPVPQLYLYRNWVIEAFNEDMPYDRFVREQIAGDLLSRSSEEERRRGIIATGYLAGAKRFGSRVDDYPWHLTIEDAIDNLGRTFLGLTTGCARCHDHKFDPITAEDYYGLYGILQSTRWPWPGIELEKVPRDLTPLVSAEEAAAGLEERRRRREELQAEVKRLEAELKEAEKKKDKAAEELKKRIGERRREDERLARGPLPFPAAYAVADAAKPSDARVQLRGLPENPGTEVRRRFPEVLGGARLPAEARGSGRRELAEWIVDPSNPLTARVMVNRIWHGHFGKGIVPTPSNFGKQGLPPTHPELLDWLAARFIESGWSLKAMHRLILRSRAWGLSSMADAEAVRKDPANDLLGRFERRRLEAEEIRDTILAVSGSLDRTVPRESHPFPPQESWGFTQHIPFQAVYESDRRSVYLMTQRFSAHPFLAAFDGADPNRSHERRLASTTSLQALWFLNGSFLHEKAASLARRLLEERPDEEARIARAFALALGREPAAEEFSQAAEHLRRARKELAEGGAAAGDVDRLAWESLARVVLRLDELVYVH